MTLADHSLAVHGRYHIDLAGKEDDGELRALLRKIPMTGPVAITLRRDPGFFDAMTVEGPFQQVLVARETATGRIVGTGSRSVRRRWVDGHPEPVGYLSGLRLLPEARRTTLLMRGYRELARLHADGRTRFYVTTIAEGNLPALAALTGARAGLPAYHDLGRYLTFVVPVRRRVPGRADSMLRISPVCREDMPRLIAFLDRTGRDRLFFPCLTADDFAPAAGTFRGLALDGVLGAWRGDELVGTLAAWDQSAFRQTVVEGYGGVVRCWKPIHNALAGLTGWPRFPAPGSPFPYVTLALPLAGDSDVFLKMLAALQRRLRSSRAEALLLGLFELDPLVPAARRLAVHSYATRVYAVTWDPATVKPQRFNGRNLYLELGCL